MLRSLHFTAPTLFTLGALNAFTAQQRQDHAALATALCLCICAAGLLAEDLLQHAFRRDRVVLAHGAVHPGAAAGHIARALGARERVVARSLSRLTEEGLRMVETDGATPAVRAYRVAR